MLTLDELYKEMLKRAAEGKDPKKVDNGDPRMIACLAHPENTPVVWRTKPCLCPPEEQDKCTDRCTWGALEKGPDGVQVNDDKCVGCEACVDACKLEALKTKKDIIPVVEALKKATTPIYALVAPAFSGQFGRTFPRANCARRKRSGLFRDAGSGGICGYPDAEGSLGI